MFINIVSVGLPRSKQVQQLTHDYMERINKYSRVSLKAVKQEPLLQGNGDVAVRKEAKKLIGLMKDCYNIVLDKDGEMMSSESFAKFLNNSIMGGTRIVNVIIGGPTGIDMSVKQRADKVLSLSRMTFSHEITMVIIAEQLYRAFTIMHGIPYHR